METDHVFMHPFVPSLQKPYVNLDYVLRVSEETLIPSHYKCYCNETLNQSYMTHG